MLIDLVSEVDSHYDLLATFEALHLTPSHPSTPRHQSPDCPPSPQDTPPPLQPSPSQPSTPLSNSFPSHRRTQNYLTSSSHQRRPRSSTSPNTNIPLQYPPSTQCRRSLRSSTPIGRGHVGEASIDRQFASLRTPPFLVRDGLTFDWEWRRRSRRTVEKEMGLSE